MKIRLSAGLPILMVVVFFHTAIAGVCEQYESTGRFDDNGNGTVTDIDSGLTWMRCAVGQQWNGNACNGQALLVNWQEASMYSEGLNDRGGYAAFTDWRLPKLIELATIAEARCDPPRINLHLFPNTLAKPFWTRDTTPADTEEAYTLSFGAEGVRGRLKSERYFVRLVRGRD